MTGGARATAFFLSRDVVYHRSAYSSLHGEPLEQGESVTAKAAPKQLKNVRGPYVFQNRRTFKLAALLKLDPIHQQQFVLQAQSYMGTNARTVMACADAIADNDGYAVDQLSIDLWEIAQVGHEEAVFEYWVGRAGDGEVFWAGEARPTSVQSVQHEFQSLEEDEASHALAAALQAVAPAAV